MPRLNPSPLLSRVPARARISARGPASLPPSPGERKAIPRVPLNGHGALVPGSPARDIQISFPETDRIQIQSRALFSNAYSLFSRRFIERAFLAPEVESVGIDGNKRRAEISIRPSGTL